MIYTNSTIPFHQRVKMSSINILSASLLCICFWNILRLFFIFFINNSTWHCTQFCQHFKVSQYSKQLVLHSLASKTAHWDKNRRLEVNFYEYNYYSLFGDIVDGLCSKRSNKHQEDCSLLVSGSPQNLASIWDQSNNTEVMTSFLKSK